MEAGLPAVGYWFSVKYFTGYKPFWQRLTIEKTPF